MTLDVALAALPVWRGLTAERYDAMVSAGLLEDAPVELLEGVLVEMATQGEPHVEAIAMLTRWFVPRLPEQWILRPRGPLAAGATSVPEPDLAVALLTPGVRPRTAALVIEVAETSQREDLVAKPLVYAAAP